MSKKSEKLLKAIKSLQEMFAFQDEVKKLLNLEIYELQPSDTAGVLFDLLTDELLTPEGSDIMCEFVFAIEEYNADNPMVITEIDKDDTEKKYELKSVEDLCEFLDDNKYFK